MKKILVVDDDATIALVLKIRLKFAGYEVLTASDGVSGLQLAVESRPDLAILDICMPLGGGFSLAHRLRERIPDLPIIFFTASKQEGLREIAKNLGAAGFIEKPYLPEDLLALVTQALKSSPGRPVISEKPVEIQPASLKPPSPAVPVPAPAPPSPPSDPKPPLRITGRHKILIVEDDRTIAMALAVRLRVAGQDVILAYDALTGLDSAIKNQPDLVLLDIGLPAGSGLVVAERIQTLVPRHTPFIFLTASRQQGLREKAMALGAAAFLEKPYNAEELLLAIQNTLNPQNS